MPTSFYASVNGLFGKLLNLASEEVILEVVRAKCIPILLYGLQCFHLGKADLQSLDFTFNRLCMKLFKTGSIDVVKDCLSCFAIDLPSCVCKKGRISSYYVTIPQWTVFVSSALICNIQLSSRIVKFSFFLNYCTCLLCYFATCLVNKDVYMLYKNAY